MAARSGDGGSARRARCWRSAAAAVLVKGGHRAGAGGGRRAGDCAAASRASFAAPWVETRNTHGTGCTLSAAIAALLAAGLPLMEAVRGAKRYLTAALAAGRDPAIGGGHGPVDHLFDIRRRPRPSDAMLIGLVTALRSRQHATLPAIAAATANRFDDAREVCDIQPAGLTGAARLCDVAAGQLRLAVELMRWMRRDAARLGCGRVVPELPTRSRCRARRTACMRVEYRGRPDAMAAVRSEDDCSALARWLVGDALVRARSRCANPVLHLPGRWSGPGNIVMSNGETEQMRCIATYFVESNGAPCSRTCAAPARATRSTPSPT